MSQYLSFEDYRRRELPRLLGQIAAAPVYAPVPPLDLTLFRSLLPPPQPSYEVERAIALIRDGFTCRYCQAFADEVDHIQPRSKGGPDWSWNLVAACGPCNRAAGDLYVGGLDIKRPIVQALRMLG